MFSKLSQLRKRKLEMYQFDILLLICLLIIVIIIVVLVSQRYAEKDMFDNPLQEKDYTLAKLRAEIRQINSDTIGSLFWLKLIALFITVGSAVGGYLIGQSKVNLSRIEAEDNRTKARLDFEKRKDVDNAYQAIVQELSGTQDVLRAAAAVKLGAILKSFPFEWNTGDERKKELIDLTKQVLAAALSIEKNSKVLKTITIAIVLHNPGKDNPDKGLKLANVQNLDLSEANAADAYWARVDFSYADFYKANLSKTSFRGSVLNGAQFREATLTEAVLVSTTCINTTFKLADMRYSDMRHADFSNAKFVKVDLEGAKMYGTKWNGTEITDTMDTQVDISADGNGSEMVSFLEWRNLPPAE